MLMLIRKIIKIRLPEVEIFSNSPLDLWYNSWNRIVSQANLDLWSSRNSSVVIYKHQFKGKDLTGDTQLPWHVILQFSTVVKTKRCSPFISNWPVRTGEHFSCKLMFCKRSSSYFPFYSLMSIFVYKQRKL